MKPNTEKNEPLPYERTENENTTQVYTDPTDVAFKARRPSALITHGQQAEVW